MSRINSEYLNSLREKLDIERIKTERNIAQKGMTSVSDYDERQNFINNQYRINGEYYYNRELQNQDFETLKTIYKKVSTNFFILNNSVKDIIYKWPERKKSIEDIFKEEKEKLDVGGQNSYSNKLFAYLSDGVTVNENKQDDYSYREFSLPRKFGHEADIERDPIFEFKMPTIEKTFKPYIKKTKP